MAVAPVYVDAPPVSPMLFGLLDTVTVIPDSDPHIGLGVQYESEFCGYAQTFPPACTGSPSASEEDGITVVTGEPIPLYHLFQCRAPGAWDRAEERAVRSLDLGASRALEVLFQNLIATGATDLTPGGTPVTDVVDALGRLESGAGALYGGTPVIHMTRAQATRLISRQAVFRVGDHLETGLGSLVVAGAGYTNNVGPSLPAASAGWMIATGQVVIRQGPTILSGNVLVNPYDNEFQSIAERVYVPTYECFHIAVEVAEPF